MNVKDLILYQVATDRHYKVGDKLFFGKDKMNGQGERVLNTQFYNNEKSLAQVGFDYADSKRIFKDKNIVIKLSKGLAESDFVIRELAMEKVRQEIAPNEPSRLHCMFLTANKDNVVRGVKEFYKKGFGSNFQAIAVKLNGKIFIATSGIGRQGKSYAEYMSLAEDYWRQKETNINQAVEILFEGSAEVMEIIDEVNIKRKN